MRTPGRAGSLAVAGVLMLGTGVLAAAPAQAAGCGVQGGVLICGHAVPTDVFGAPGRPVDTLVTSPHGFVCWTTGDAGSRWYRVRGDLRSAWGQVPASVVDTSAVFDADPGAYGLRHC
ncbi:hypothetical protein ACODT5_38500 [Streptomyces sp. 5.8]|uniref:hypothetical protein n=1 Tax=Streptomyces sp. 5.8 TaxID=3406571 RepID=UPI003BB800F6